MKRKVLISFTLVMSLCLFCGCDNDIEDIPNGDFPNWMHNEIDEVTRCAVAHGYWIDSVKTQIYSTHLSEKPCLNIRVTNITNPVGGDEEDPNYQTHIKKESGCSRFYSHDGERMDDEYKNYSSILDDPSGELLWEVTEKYSISMLIK